MKWSASFKSMLVREVPFRRHVSAGWIFVSAALATNLNCRVLAQTSGDDSDRGS